MHVARFSNIAQSPYSNHKQNRKDVAFGDFRFKVGENAQKQLNLLVDEACLHEGADSLKKVESLSKFNKAVKNLFMAFNVKVKRVFYAERPPSLEEVLKKPHDLINEFDDGEVILDKINFENWIFGKTSSHSVATSDFRLGFVTSKGEPLLRVERDLVYQFKSKPNVTLDDLNHAFEQVGDWDEAEIDASRFVKAKLNNYKCDNKNG